MSSLKTPLALLLALAVVALTAFGWRLYTVKNASWIRDRSLAASSGVSSYFYTIFVSTGSTGVLEGAEVNVSSFMAGNVSVDLRERFMHSPMEVRVEGYSGGSPVSMHYGMELYVVDGTLYSRSGDSWIKGALGEDAWNNTLLSRQEEVFKDTGVNLVGTDVVRGVEAYVLEFRPDVEDVMGYAVDVSGSTPLESDSSGDVLEDYAIREWVSTESFLPLKTETWFTAVSRGVKTRMNITVDYYDYGIPVAIELPEEAAGAVNADSSLLFSP